MFDLSVIIIVATFFAYLARILKQPLIPAYIIAGLVLGPIGLGVVRDLGLIKALSEIGIAFLLFIVGLEIDFKKLRSVSFVSLIGGTLQVILTFLFGYIISLFLGLSETVSIYAGLVVAFSSTMVVVKLLGDKGEIGTLHGRIILGILLMQDILVFFALAMMNSLTEVNYIFVGFSLLKLFSLFFIAFIASRYLLPGLFRFAAKSNELLFLLSITMCFLFAIFAYFLGFSIAIGAFIAGVGVANLPYSFDIIGKVVSLKDFFATIFFVSLGMQLVFISADMLKLLGIFLLIVVIFKPLLLLILSSLFGYEKRTSFLTAVSLGQVSEFSLILVGTGFYTLKHVSQEFFSLVVFMTIITITITSYLFKHEAAIYRILAGPLEIFRHLALYHRKMGYTARESKDRVVLFGCHRMGSIFLKTFSKAGKNTLVIDHDPDVIDHLIKEKVNCMYGDMDNSEVLRRIVWKNTELVVSAVQKFKSSVYLVEYVKSVNPKTSVFVTAKTVGEALDLYELGADYVILPHISAGELIASLLKKVIKSKKDLVRFRNDHIKHLLSLGELHY